MGRGSGAVQGRRDGVCIKDSEEIYVDVSAGKGNHSKWNINGIHFLAVSCRHTLEVQGKISLCNNNCYLYKRTALDISKCEVSR